MSPFQYFRPKIKCIQRSKYDRVIAQNCAQTRGPTIKIHNTNFKWTEVKFAPINFDIGVLKRRQCDRQIR